MLAKLLSRSCLALICITIVVALPGSASALDLKKRYERDLIRWALDQRGLTEDPHPDGKRIEKIVVVRENVIAKSDPWPNLLNIFHIKTRDYIVRQELLLKVGDAWEKEKVAETERNLRGLFILAVARTVACRSKKPGHVVLLVVTKDIWSIRLNIIFSQTGPVVKLAEFTPTEANFLGRNKRLSAHLRVSQFTFSGPVVRDHVAIGQRYFDPRVLGSRLRLSQAFDVIVDGKVPCGGSEGGRTNLWCADTTSGAIAGVFASLSLSRPLYSLDTKWGFALSGSVDIRQRRRFLQSGDGGLSLSTIELAKDLHVPYVYDGRRLQTQVSFTRRYGKKLKHDLSWGVLAYRLQYKPPENFPFARAVKEFFAANFLPRSESAAAFFLGYDLSTTRFIRLRNVRGFALSEDYAIGPQFSISASFGNNLERSTQSFISLTSSAAYRWYMGGDMLTISASASARIQPEIEEAGFSGPLLNKRLELGIGNISPTLGVGRFHAQVVAVWRSEDLNRSFSTLGSDSGLRGYPNDQFDGRNLLRVNVEYRTLPINFFTLHMGLVAFYDGGAVWGNPFPAGKAVPFAYRQSVGLGVRGHFPQFDRESLRIDLGFPLNSPHGGFGTWISLSFGQIF